jgi:hypothetical protein
MIWFQQVVMHVDKRQHSHAASPMKDVMIRKYVYPVVLIPQHPVKSFWP